MGRRSTRDTAFTRTGGCNTLAEFATPEMARIFTNVQAPVSVSPRHIYYRSHRKYLQTRLHDRGAVGVYIVPIDRLVDGYPATGLFDDATVPVFTVTLRSQVL